MGSMQISRRDMVFLNLDSSVGCADVAPWLHRLRTPASKQVSILEGSNEMRGAYCDLPTRFNLMYKARAVPAPDPMQPDGSWHTWVTIGVYGTNRWNMGLCPLRSGRPLVQSLSPPCATMVAIVAPWQNVYQPLTQSALDPSHWPFQHCPGRTVRAAF